MRSFATAIVDRLLVPFVRRVRAKSNSVDLTHTIQQRAVEDAADFVLAQMPQAMAFNEKNDLLLWALRKSKRDGLILEFGVFGGQSINAMAKVANQTVHGFDSFEGLQEDWGGTLAGRGYFNRGGKLPVVASNVVLSKGWFQDTLPGFLASHPGPIRLLHVDCDTYESTKFVLESLVDRIGPGTLIKFDEYLGYAGWRHGEHKAWEEFVSGNTIKFRYIGYASQAVAVEVIST